MTVNALKLLQQLIPYQSETFASFVREHCTGLERPSEYTNTIVNEVELSIHKDITPALLLSSAMLVAAQNIQNDTDYDKIAARFRLTEIYTQALRMGIEGRSFQDIYFESFKSYIEFGIKDGLLDAKLSELFDLDALAHELDTSRDDMYQFIGLSTALQRYYVKDRNQRALETPQFMWMRIAMGLSINEKNPTDQAKKFYNKLSQLEYIPGGSTNIGAGTTYPVLSNCYIMDTEDDLHHIFDNVKNIALISKATGGIGIAVTKLRAAGAPVKTNNTFSTGPIPFIKVMDTAVKSVSRAGKKAGAVCVYMENWHLNFPEFLDLRQNAGDDYRRIRTANTAVYISDEFMKRVISNDKWYMFDPAETPELTELYGPDFSKKYQEYVEKAERGELRMHKVIPAREQMKHILTSLQSTSHPWLTWKDTINLRALNNNTGTIHSSNLCTEVCLPQDRENIAVCNLAYINLSRHILDGAGAFEDRVDWERLRETVHAGMRHLDNLIDVNMSPLPETKRSDDNNRAVGLGIMGLAESFEKLGFGYDSEDAFEFTDRVMEFISYHTIDASCDLAEERGAYPNFEGSMWAKGYVPFDTIQKVADARQNANAHIGPVQLLKEKIAAVAEKTSTQEAQEIYAIFNQLVDMLPEQPKDTRVTGQLPFHHKEYELQQNTDITMNWDDLRKRVTRGVRNATTMMIAPNASTGLVAGTSPGIDPRFSLIFSRSTSTGKYLDINQCLVTELKKRNLWYQVKDDLLATFGDISEMEAIPEDLRKVYKTSFQISPYALIEVASRAQKWIDQAMSRNMYLETRDINEMIDIYTNAWLKGLKTTYYLHTKPRQRSEQSMVRINKGADVAKAKEATVKDESSSPGALRKKAHGFGRVAVSEPVAEKNNRAFGFRKARSGEPKAKELGENVGLVHGETSVIISSPDTKVSEAFLQACPLDPAERAQCEACQ